MSSVDHVMSAPRTRRWIQGLTRGRVKQDHPAGRYDGLDDGMVPMTGAKYELRLRGPVSSRTLRVFEEMDMNSVTLVNGVIEDQAVLDGLLERIRDLGLEVIDVHQITNERASAVEVEERADPL